MKAPLLLAAGLGLCAQASTFCAFAAEPYTLRGALEQGGAVFGHTVPAASVKLDGRKLLLTAAGDFVFGFDRDAGPDAELHVTVPGRPEVVRHLSVRARHWDIQRIDGLQPGLVNAPPEVEQRIAAEAKLIAAAHAQDTPIDGFSKGFEWPAHGRISDAFGGQRILNGTPKQPHSGVDVAVPTGTPVHAPFAGVVTLAEPDLYFGGGTVIVDHGHGLFSALMHLSKLLVKPGDQVRRGQVVALSGSSGRATGPHLHWSLFWFDAHLDAQRLFGPATILK